MDELSLGPEQLFSYKCKSATSTKGNAGPSYNQYPDPADVFPLHQLALLPFLLGEEDFSWPEIFDATSSPVCRHRR